MKTKIKYKTVRQRYILLASINMILLIFAGIAIVVDGGGFECPAYMAIFIWFLGIAPFVYCVTFDLKRNKFKKLGTRTNGRVIGYYSPPGGRGIAKYYLKIVFYESEKKTYITEAYDCNPNDKLANTSCYIYNYNGKYIEADLNTLKKGEKPRGLNIPIVNEGVFPKIKSGSVTVVEQTKDEKG